LIPADAAAPVADRNLLAALRLGCTSFGGPVAHLAYFRREYVERRRWLDEAHYADLVGALSVSARAREQPDGLWGRLPPARPGRGSAAWLGFTLPSAILMIGLAYGIARLGSLETAGWLRGLKVAAVAVVAQAVWLMSRSLCPDWPRRAMAVAAAGLMLWMPLPGPRWPSSRWRGHRIFAEVRPCRVAARRRTFGRRTARRHPPSQN